jgi:hypothetical protein
MVMEWISVCVANLAAWGISGAALAELVALKDAAVAALAAIQNESTRTPVSLSACRSAFAALEVCMRSFKRRYFHIPPLTAVDFVSLGLKVPDTTRTPVTAPETAPEFSIVQMGPGAISIVYWDGEKGKKGSKPKGVEGARIYYLISGVPITDQNLLAFSKWATKCPHIIRFREEDRGKTVYFALKWEIHKENGESPWSRIQSERVS